MIYFLVMYLTVAEAAKRFPRPVHERTVVRRICSGCNGIRLQAVFDGDRYLIKPEWIDEFIQQTTKTRAAFRPAIEDESDFWQKFRAMRRTQ